MGLKIQNSCKEVAREQRTRQIDCETSWIHELGISKSETSGFKRAIKMAKNGIFYFDSVWYDQTYVYH